MYLTNRKRVQKVFLSLIKNPSHIIPYFQYALTKKTPLEIGLPWWSYKSITKVESLLNSNMTVFEWGSGGSTVFICHRVKSIVSVENDNDWATKVNSALSSINAKNAKVIQKEINLQSAECFLKCPYAKEISNKFDLIVIDGEDHFNSESHWSARENCFDLSQQSINKNGIIIVDDAWRYPSILDKSKAKKILKLESIGPCRLGVTRTDLHFY
jgi:hypothetical protein